MVARTSSGHHCRHPRFPWWRRFAIVLTADALGFLENVFDAMDFAVYFILQDSSRAQSGLVPVLDVALLCGSHRANQEKKFACIHIDVD